KARHIDGWIYADVSQRCPSSTDERHNEPRAALSSANQQPSQFAQTTPIVVGPSAARTCPRENAGLCEVNRAKQLDHTRGKEHGLRGTPSSAAQRGRTGVQSRANEGEHHQNNTSPSFR